MLVSPSAANLGRSRGAVAVATVGMALIALGMLWMALVGRPGQPALLALAPAMVAIGIGHRPGAAELVAAALAAVPAADIGKASAVLNTARQVGAVVGVAVGVAIFQGAGGAGASATHGRDPRALLVSSRGAGARGAHGRRGRRPARGERRDGARVAV